jgi:multicomponent Na+:H+ antiporter subunit G
VRDIVAVVLCIVGLAFSVTGAVGMLRMPDLYTRIQCSSKTVTMGLLPTLVGLVVAKGPITQYGGRALFVGGLVLLVNPAASHAIARAAYKVGLPIWKGSVVDEPRERRPVKYADARAKDGR